MLTLPDQSWLLESLRHMRQSSEARAVCERLSREVDETVRDAIAEAVPESVLAVLGLWAVGGYGRGEFFPHADIDLLVLYDGPDGTPDDASERVERAAPGADASLRALLLALKRRRLRVALRVRSLAEQARWILHDISVAAAALDARPLAGATGALREPREQARTLIGDAFPGGAPGFVTRLRSEIVLRHGAGEDASALLEPDLKTGRGSLRDGHAVRWAAIARFGIAESRELVDAGILTDLEGRHFDEAYWFFARVRLCLHAVSRFKLDRLVFERQPAVARLMGFGHGADHEAAAAFMQVFYAHADQLANLADRWLLDWGHDGDEEIEPIDGSWRLRAGLLDRQPDAPEPRDLVAIRDAVRMCARHHTAAHPALRRRLREISAGLHARAGSDPVACDIVRHVVCEAADPYPLRLLLDLSIFRRIVPEWSHLVGHTTHDVYHVWTTDRHLFESWRMLLRLQTAAESQDARDGAAIASGLLSAWGRLEQRGAQVLHAVRLATLLHDVGKALDGDHSMIGAGMAAEVARRLGMESEMVALVRWLVLEHLTLARTSQRRDIGDPAVVESCAAILGEPWHLDALTVLTWADMNSVSPVSPSEWKTALLLQLHDAIREVVGVAAGRPQTVTERYLRRVQELGAEPAPDYRGVIERLDPASIRAFSADELVEIVEALREWNDKARDGAVVRWRTASDGGTAAALPGWTLRVTVVVADRDALLAHLAAAASAAGFDVLHARITTTRDGLAVDQFVLGRVRGGRRSGPEQFAELVQRIAAGAETYDSLRARRREEATLRRPGRPDVPTDIRVLSVDHDASLRIVEVRTRDRIGLLADMAAFFAQRGLPIERALVQVEGDRAVDTFYVRGPADEAVASDLRTLLSSGEP